MNASGGGNKITGMLNYPSHPSHPSQPYRDLLADVMVLSDSGHGHEITEDKTAK
jgi:hypothetical protein